MLRIESHCAGLALPRASPLIRGIPRGAPSCFCLEDLSLRVRTRVLPMHTSSRMSARKGEGRSHRARPDGQARQQACD